MTEKEQPVVTVLQGAKRAQQASGLRTSLLLRNLILFAESISEEEASAAQEG